MGMIRSLTPGIVMAATFLLAMMIPLTIVISMENVKATAECRKLKREFNSWGNLEDYVLSQKSRQHWTRECLDPKHEYFGGQPL